MKLSCQLPVVIVVPCGVDEQFALLAPLLACSILSDTFDPN
jgi:hypothetical protein